MEDKKTDRQMSPIELIEMVSNRAHTEYGQKTASSQICVRDAVDSIINFARTNRDTVLPFVREQSKFAAALNITYSDDELIDLYVLMMIDDTMNGLTSIRSMLNAKGYEFTCNMMDETSEFRKKRIAEHGTTPW